MKLTKTDRIILESYKVMIDGLSDYLGSGYEMVLHSLENYDRSVIKIINGYYSGRKDGAPITDLALKMLKQIECNDGDHMFTTYFNTKANGGLIKSSTIPILGEKDRIIGLLCINFYMDIPLYQFMEQNLPNPDTFGSVRNQKEESFPSKIDELISSALNNAKNQVSSNTAILSTNRNREILLILYNEGIFNIKDAVSKIAEGLGISKNTVYLHLRSFENNKKQ